MYKSIQGVQGIRAIQKYTGCTRGYTLYMGYTRVYRVYKGIHVVYGLYKGIQGVQGDTRCTRVYRVYIIFSRGKIIVERLFDHFIYTLFSLNFKRKIYFPA